MACSFKRLNKDRYAAKTVVYYTHFTHVLFNSSVHKKNPHQFSYDVVSALVWQPIKYHALSSKIQTTYHNTQLSINPDWVACGRASISAYIYSKLLSVLVSEHRYHV